MSQPDPRWDRLKDLFAAAAAVPPGEREAFLRERGVGDATVQEVLDLLGSSAPVDEQPGDTIGPYKLLECLGEGGYGTVWMAEQRSPIQRLVALKLLKAGMDSAQVLARFEQERQALALMQHPNIAQVYDAGTTQRGRPFFVMELVKGVPITDYATRERLDLRQRLLVFEQVCRAVQHAHQKGVIHRDIKPSNVLVVTADGRPLAKVIDFGIAKATAGRLTERTLFTEHRAMVGTLAYMSPEQAEGLLDVDTRADVYSLGALLYELLTGGTPFDPGKLVAAGFGEMLRVLREVEPERPSVRVSSKAGAGWVAGGALGERDPKRLFGSLRGDLDWVVMKTLEKDRARRYGSAEGLAADVGRYLGGEAVEAVPPSVGYRVRKFVRRHRGLVTATLLTACTIGLGLWAVSAKAGAERNLTTSNQVIDELLNRLRSERASNPSDPLAGSLDEIIGDVADIYWGRGQNERAIILWREALSLDPEDGEWKRNLEAAERGLDSRDPYFLTREEEAARDQLDRAINSYRAGAYDECERLLTGLGRTPGHDAEPMEVSFLSMAQSRLGQRDAALANLTLLDNYDPDNLSYSYASFGLAAFGLTCHELQRQARAVFLECFPDAKLPEARK